MRFFTCYEYIYLFLVAAAVLGFYITDRYDELKRGVRKNKEDIKTLEKVR